jgi:hypothetical protein
MEDVHLAVSKSLLANASVAMSASVSVDTLPRVFLLPLADLKLLPASSKLLPSSPEPERGRVCARALRLVVAALAPPVF